MSSRRILYACLFVALISGPLATEVARVDATEVSRGAPAAGAVQFRPHNYADNGVDTPDPSIISSNAHFFAVSTAGVHKNCSGAFVNMWVPHRSTTDLGSWPNSPCFADVMPGGVGAWAGGAGANVFDTWAPSIARNSATGTYLLFYAAKKAGTSQHCIGRATAAGVTGPYTPDATALICPTTGNWAIDPNAFTESGRLYLLWRQDPGATSTRLYAAEYSDDGRTRLTVARLLMDSGDMTWDGPVPGGSRIIENPSVIHWGLTGQYYISFSGDYFANSDYATGMAVCGTVITSGGKCVLQAPSTESFFGYSARGHGGTLKTVPADLPGPGGMSFVTRDVGGFVGAADHGYVAMNWDECSTCPLFRPMLVFEMFDVDTSPRLTNF